MMTWAPSNLSAVYKLRFRGEQPRFINPFYVTEEGRQHCVHSDKKRSTYEAVVSATDGLLGARSTTPRTDHRDRGAAETDETINGGKGEPEQSAEFVEGCGSRLQRGRWLARGAGKTHALGAGAALH